MTTPAYLALSFALAAIFFAAVARGSEWQTAPRRLLLAVLASLLGLALVATIVSVFAGERAVPDWTKLLTLAWMPFLGIAFLLDSREPTDRAASRRIAGASLVVFGLLAVAIDFHQYISE